MLTAYCFTETDRKTIKFWIATGINKLHCCPGHKL